MQLGLLVEVEEGLTWEQLRRAARAAEQLGYVGLWLSDHLDSPHRPGLGGLETWTALAVVAAETRRVQLGPMVTPVTFRPPALVARMAAGLGALSDGRFVLGLGAGWNEAEHRAFGIEFPPVSERLWRLEQALAMMRPRLELPILIGGAGERRTLPLAARFADEWNLTTADPAFFRAKAAHLDACCHAIGRDPRTLRRSVCVGFVVGRDRADLRRAARAMQGLVPALAAVAVDEVPAAARALGWVAGTPEQVLEQLGRLAEAGVDRVMLNHFDHANPAALELIASEVAPRLRPSRR
jgi:alkanesulfonate monooxygenase SsuD/methylene tetrahydromethanopterin reductase-like flavin-dependent oxidoreductase (luciferase family)